MFRTSAGGSCATTRKGESVPSRACEFRDNVKSAWASRPVFTSRDGTLRAVVQHEGGLIIPAHSLAILNNASDRALAEFGAWLVDTFGDKEVHRG